MCVVWRLRLVVGNKGGSRPRTSSSAGRGDSEAPIGCPAPMAQIGGAPQIIQIIAILATNNSIGANK